MKLFCNCMSECDPAQMYAITSDGILIEAYREAAATRSAAAIGPNGVVTFVSYDAYLYSVSLSK